MGAAKEKGGHRANDAAQQQEPMNDTRTQESALPDRGGAATSPWGDCERVDILRAEHECDALAVLFTPDVADAINLSDRAAARAQFSLECIRRALQHLRGEAGLGPRGQAT